jgi:hypothetical protein
VWIIVIIFLVLILSWLLFAPLELQVDTRTPQACVRWITIGKAILTYENEKWWLRMRVLFFHKQWELEKLLFAKKKRRKPAKRIKKQAKPAANKLRKFFNVMKSFRVTKWQVGIDTGDVTEVASLYPLNFLPHTWKHCHLNFIDENYFLMTVRNTPWKLAYAFFKMIISNY